MKKYRLFAVSSIFLLISTYLLFSPLITIALFAKTLKDNNSERFTKYINFPSLRSDLSNQISSIIEKRTYSELENTENSSLKILFIKPFIKNLVKVTVDSTVTPKGLKVLLETGNIKNVNQNINNEGIDSSFSNKKPEINLYYRNINEFILSTKPSSLDQPITTVWKRTFINTWKLNSIKLPIK